MGTPGRSRTAPHWVSETRDDRFPGVRRVAVVIAAGRIEIGARRGSDVRIRTTRAETGWRARVARRSPPTVPTAEIAGEALQLTADVGQLRVRLDVPAGTAVDAQVDVGDLTLWGVGGRLHLRVGTGVLAGRDLDADRVDAENAEGEVNLHFVARPSRVTARSRTGPVLIVLPEGRYNVDADAGAEVTVAVDDESTAAVITRSGGRTSVLAATGSKPI